MQRFSMILNGVLLIAVLWVWNASAGIPGGPDTAPASTMSYKIDDIYNRLHDGTAGSQSAFADSSATAGTGTMHTLNEVMAKAPAKDDTKGASTTDVVKGKTFWGLTSGQWGKQEGEANVGENVTGEEGKRVMTIPDGFYSGSKTATAQDSDLKATNIKSGVDIFAITGSLVEPTGDAIAENVLKDKTFSNASSTNVNGTMVDHGAKTITPGTSDQTIPKGYHNGSGTVSGDSDLVASKIKKDVEIFGVKGTFTIYQAAVRKTGQKTCYKDNTKETTPCAGTGQDGDKPAGVDWPNPRFTINGNGTVTDNLTGLIWLRNANCEGTRNWYNALDFANKLANGKCGLSDGSKAGDWRLPNRFELESLLNLEYNDKPLSNTDGTGQWKEGDPFQGVQSYYYWSSSTDSDNPGYAWVVYLNDGFVSNGGKAYNVYYVWPVRGGQ